MAGGGFGDVDDEVGVGDDIFDVRRLRVARAEGLPHVAHRVGVVPDPGKVAEQVDGVEVGPHPGRIYRLDDLADVFGGIECGGDVALQGEDDAGVLSPGRDAAQAGDQAVASGGQV